MGGAESGVGAAVLAKVKGFDVFLSDNGVIKEEYARTLQQWDIPYEQGGHTPEKILNADGIKAPRAATPRSMSSLKIIDNLTLRFTVFSSLPIED